MQIAEPSECPPVVFLRQRRKGQGAAATFMELKPRSHGMIAVRRAQTQDLRKDLVLRGVHAFLKAIPRRGPHMEERDHPFACPALKGSEVLETGRASGKGRNRLPGPGGRGCTGPQSRRHSRGCYQDPVPPGSAFSRTRHALSRGNPCAHTLPCRLRAVIRFLRSAPEVAGG